MTYNVGDRVLYMDDPGMVIAVSEDPHEGFPYSVQFDDGGAAVAAEDELEEA